MKVKFFVNNNANIHSVKDTGWLCSVKDLGYDEGDWEKLTDSQKSAEAEEWANSCIEIWYEEQGE